MNVAPVLMCEKCATATLHIFIETRPRRRRRGEIPYVDCIYSCDACGARRGWGIEPREAALHGRRLSDATFVHAQDEHGMRWAECPRCRGLGGDCAECEGEGETWIFGSIEPCGAACPIESLDELVGE